VAFEVLMMMTMKNTVFWNVTKYWLKNEYQSFKETCSSSFLKMENSFL
jgi:hypothetical protein